MRITLPDAVNAELRTAGYGSRALAYSVDFLLRWGTFCAIAVIGLLAYSFLADMQLHLEETVRGWFNLDTDYGFFNPLAIGFFLFLVTEFGYPIYFEVKREGVTPGKRMFGLRVVDEQGFPVTFQASAVRTILLTVDMLPLIGFVGLVSILSNSKRQRLGDLAARTVVIYDEEQREIDAFEDSKGAEAKLYTLPLELFNALDEYLLRHAELDVAANERIATRLVPLVTPFVDLPPAPTELVAKVEWLLKIRRAARPEQQAYELGQAQ